VFRTPAPGAVFADSDAASGKPEVVFADVVPGTPLETYRQREVPLLAGSVRFASRDEAMGALSLLKTSATVPSRLYPELVEDFVALPSATEAEVAAQHVRSRECTSVLRQSCS
jgi:hypothetical protein